MKRGDTFVHKHWRTADKKPMECIVTKVAKGTIYYRPVGGGSPACFRADQISKYLAGVCDKPFHEYVMMVGGMNGTR